MAERAVQGLSVVFKSLSVTGCCFPFSPGTSSFNASNTINYISESLLVSVIGHLPVKHTLNLMVSNAWNNLRHNVRADITAITHMCCQNIANIIRISLMSSGRG